MRVALGGPCSADAWTGSRRIPRDGSGWSTTRPAAPSPRAPSSPGIPSWVLPGGRHPRRVRRPGPTSRGRGAAAGRQGGQRLDDPAGATAARRGRGPAVGRAPRRRDPAEGMAAATFTATSGEWCRTSAPSAPAAPSKPKEGWLAERRPSAQSYTAGEVARRAGAPHHPTAEQSAVIEAPPRAPPRRGRSRVRQDRDDDRTGCLDGGERPLEPDQVLGLTFTRKAATELSERLTARIRTLRRAGLVDPRGTTCAETLGGTPTVSTYHSYAGRLVREHALRLGEESDSRLLSEAAAWQLRHGGRPVLRRPDGPGDPCRDDDHSGRRGPGGRDGRAPPHDRRGHGIPRGLGGRPRIDPPGVEQGDEGASGADLRMRDDLRERRAILPVVDRYLDPKRRRDAMDFSDQMALAARLAMSFDDIGAIERRRFRAVLLDEFQDTSRPSSSCSRALFAPPGQAVPVTAVGDPHQSIYGVAGGERLDVEPLSRRSSGPARGRRDRPLSTSWRNDRRSSTPRTSSPHRCGSRRGSPSPRSGRAPDRGTGVSAARFATVEEEAAHVAGWVADRRADGASDGGRPVPQALAVRPAHRGLRRPRPPVRGRGARAACSSPQRSRTSSRSSTSSRTRAAATT